MNNNNEEVKIPAHKLNPLLDTIHGHTFRGDLLTKGGYVLDLGCNDFVFSNYMVSVGMKVIALDPIKNITIPKNLENNPNFTYLQRACVGVKNGDTATYYEYLHWGANSLVNKPEMLHRSANGGHANNPYKASYEVPLTTLTELMSEFNIPKFEFIKIDIEGSEYDILSTFPHECTKQLSVEFHAFLGLNPSDDIEGYHDDLTNNKLSSYSVEFEDRDLLDSYGGEYGEVFQRNDVLYVLKKYTQ
tara:strand:+ start:3882 stop:4616 length:735 start_codon:yes stop_codon:yes gene_type:complete